MSCRQWAAGASQLVALGSTPGFTAVPFSFSCWFNAADATGVYQLVSILRNAGDVGASNDSYYSLYANAGVLSLERAQSTAYPLFSTTAAYQARTWHHAVVVMAAVNSAAIYLDGANKATSSTSITPAGMNDTQIGAFSHPFYSGYSNVMLADVAFWNVALTDAEAYLLAKGRRNSGDKIRPWDIQRAALTSCPNLSMGGVTAVPDRITARGSWAVTNGASPMPTPQFLRPRRKRPLVMAEQAGGGGGTLVMPRRRSRNLYRM